MTNNSDINYRAGTPGLENEQNKEPQQPNLSHFREVQEDYIAEHGHEYDVAEYQQKVEQDNFTTEFMKYDLHTIKSMVADEKSVDGVDQAGGIAHAWDLVHEELVGNSGDSGGGAYGDLLRAVTNVLQHWEGDSADGFRNESNKLLRDIANTAGHCRNAANCLRWAAGEYRKANTAMKEVEEPGWFDKTMDWLGDAGSRGDGAKYTAEQVRNRDLPKDLLAQAQENFSGAEKTAQLMAASHMEPLAMAYVHYSKQMRAKTVLNDKEAVPAPETAMPFPAPIATPSGSVPGPSAKRRPTTSANLESLGKLPHATPPRDPAISGGWQVPSSQTKIDSLPTGLSGHVADPLPNASPPGRGFTPGAGGTVGTPNVSAGGPLGIASGGRGQSTGRGPGSRPTVRGGLGSGSSEHSSGRTGGMRGIHGMGGGGGAGGKGGAAAGGRGPLARAKGGVAGAPRGITGGSPATPGGTGLGKGRGGGASEAGGRGARGMFAGGMRGTSQRPGEEENEERTRPDYLVEDEETWTPEDYRSIPRNIE